MKRPWALRSANKNHHHTTQIHTELTIKQTSEHELCCTSIAQINNVSYYSFHCECHLALSPIWYTLLQCCSAKRKRKSDFSHSQICRRWYKLQKRPRSFKLHRVLSENNAQNPIVWTRHQEKMFPLSFCTHHVHGLRRRLRTRSCEGHTRSSLTHTDFKRVSCARICNLEVLYL